MAQYFLDLSIGHSGKWPALLRGAASTYNDAEMNTSPIKKSWGNGMLIKGLGSDFRTIGAGLGSFADVDILYKATFSSIAPPSNANSSGVINIYARGDGSFTSDKRPDNCYLAAINANTDLSSNGATVSLYKVVSGVFSSIMFNIPSLSSLPTAALAHEVPLFMRFQCIGTSLKCKTWKHPDPEPATWNISATDSTFSSGQVGISYPNNNQEFISSFLSVGTGGDPPTSSFPGGNKTVSGTLLKPDGSVADGYIARCYHRESGALLGEILTDAIGAFTFSLPISSLEKVYCLGIDQLGNSWNAPIKDLISPV